MSLKLGSAPMVQSEFLIFAFWLDQFSILPFHFYVRCFVISKGLLKFQEFYSEARQEDKKAIDPLSSFVYLFFSCSIYLFFRDVLGRKEQKVQSSHILLPPHITSTIINILHQNGKSFIINETTLIHDYHPQSLVQFRVRSWRCTFYRF